MSIGRSLPLFVVACLLLAPAGLDAQAIKQAKKKHKHTGISGTIAAIHHSKEKKGTGTIKVHLHHHKPKNQQKAQAKIAKNAIAQKKKKKPHTVTVHINSKTKFAYVVKAPVAGKPKVKTVGRGNNKSKVAVPGKVKMATRKVPTHFRNVLTGQHVHVTLGAGHHHAHEVDIFPQKSAQANKQQNNK
jgi:hypothetical protein